jgi:hypothetical protein
VGLCRDASDQRLHGADLRVEPVREGRVAVVELLRRHCEQAGVRAEVLVGARDDVRAAGFSMNSNGGEVK